MHFYSKTARVLACAAVAVTTLAANQVRATDYYVDPAGLGPNGDGVRVYTTMTAALLGASKMPSGASQSNPNRLLIYPGTYTEQLGGKSLTTGANISVTQSNIDLIGLGGSASSTVLTYNLNAISAGGTTACASTNLSGNNVACSNLTFANSTPFGAGTSISQGVALKTQGDQVSFNSCRFIGYQDTLYPTGGRQYFNNCYVSGTVDFIFGNATAVFDNTTINNSYSSTITAASTAPTRAIGFVFRNCTLTGNGDGTTATGATTSSTQLGRPWQYNLTAAQGAVTLPSTIFINSKFGAHIGSANGTSGGHTEDGDWNRWDSANSNPEGDTRYAQYNNTDASNNVIPSSAYAAWSHNLTADDASVLTLANIFGPNADWNTRVDAAGKTWKVLANGADASSNIWNPVNASGSNMTQFINVTNPEYTDTFSQGGTWDPALQFATVPEPTTLASAALISLSMLRRRRSI